MKRILKIKFVDMWWHDRPQYEDDLYFQLLSRRYDLQLCEDPDYLFDGGLGYEYLKPRYARAVKILSTGENYTPDFNFFDYALGFDRLSFGDRYLRRPLFVMLDEFQTLDTRSDRMPTDEALLSRAFCSFVVSNAGGDPLRQEFFQRLSSYRPVASGGRWLNNVGGQVMDKLAFCAKYKFNIAFENSVSPGYTTEKIVQPLSVYSVPIYYGDPFVAEAFHPKCMVRVTSRADVERAVEEIVALDRDDAAYLAKIHANPLVEPASVWRQRLEDFLVHIVEQPLEQARRTVDYGFQVELRKCQRKAFATEAIVKSPWRKLRKILGK